MHSQARGLTFTSSSPYKEDGKGMLGITRGQIGAFYEREIEYNIELINTDQNGLPITSGFSATAGIPTSVDEAAFAVWMEMLHGFNCRSFPFIGAEEDKPSGTPGVIALRIYTQIIQLREELSLFNLEQQ